VGGGESRTAVSGEETLYDLHQLKNQASTHTNDTFRVVRHRAYAPTLKRIWSEMISSNTNKEDFTVGSKQKA